MTAPALERVLRKVEVGDCWLFQGKARADGYGAVWNDAGSRLAHRIVWEGLVGPIPDGMQIDHMCEQTLCVNPDHLRVVSPSENVNASKYHIAARRRRMTHCKRGHEYTDENTYNMSSGGRSCHACQRHSYYKNKENS